MDGGAVRAAVKEECNIDAYLGAQVLLAVSEINESAASTANVPVPGDATVVNLSILEVTGNGGNVYSGAKSMTVRADYMVAGKIVETTTMKVGTLGGFFGGFKGICGFLERDADTIAKRIARWVKKLPAQQTAATIQQPDPAPSNVVMPVTLKETIFVLSPIKYLDGNNISQSIKDECGLPSLTESYILEQANSEQYPIKALSAYAGKAVAMRISIIDAVGDGGGRLAGEKYVKMRDKCGARV